MQPVKQGVSEPLSPLSITARIAGELSVKATQVEAAISLLDEGATVPFIARYRKERTGTLDDTQLRTLQSRLQYLRELDERRASILKSIQEQGKLNSDLKQAIEAAETRTELEDLYLPYKPKRRTKAQVAREAGLEPLAKALLDNPELEPKIAAEKYLNSKKGVEDVEVALEGARQILMEHFTEQAELIGELREYLWQNGTLQARVVKDKKEAGKKFADYFDYDEALHKIPSHRALALFRGRNEGILRLNLDIVFENGTTHPCEMRTAAYMGIRDQGRAADQWLLESVRWAWKVRIHSRLDVDLKMRLREQAEAEAIRVFSHNLQDLLLAAPAGAKATLGLDPGLRTGVKVAVIDATGKLLETTTIYPHAPRKEWDQSIASLEKLCREHGVGLVSIGNGTASRETDKLVTELSKRHPELKLQKLVVSEAGASVYSASELAAKEFPKLDVSLRGAVSIARRLQDPLAELVKIEPKAIGVGQYQHDVNQVQLSRSLDGVIEDCVNAVGVDVNTASAALLAHIAGLNTGLAQNIVTYRNEQGAFTNRQQLLSVKRLGAKTFEQAAGFLRIMQGENPLDASAVHPEAYAVVEKMAEQHNKAVGALIGDAQALKNIQAKAFVDERFGLPTVQDILAELEKPGRDPRPEFKTAVFREGVEKIADLKEDMVLEGVVTNVTNFGAFVDIGVHQDGLVHISQLSYSFVKDPREVVKAGDVVKVRVLEVDVERKRIGLTMRLEAQKPVAAKQHKAKTEKRREKPKHNKTKSAKPARKQQSQTQGNSAMADAFRKALR